MIDKININLRILFLDLGKLNERFNSTLARLATAYLMALFGTEFSQTTDIFPA